MGSALRKISWESNSSAESRWVVQHINQLAGISIGGGEEGKYFKQRTESGGRRTKMPRGMKVCGVFVVREEHVGSRRR